MKIALIGASGNIGIKILEEALGRDHEVTAIVRHPEKLPSRAHLHARHGDVRDGPGLTALLRNHEAVISSLHFSGFDHDMLLAAIRASGIKRYIAVGGAGSLLDAAGKRVVDNPDFPEAWKEEALKGADYLEKLKKETSLNWTFLSPSALIAPGERTGTFRLGNDHLLVDNDGQSHISQEDYAIALIDELENPQHVQKRFTVGY